MFKQKVKFPLDSYNTANSSKPLKTNSKENNMSFQLDKSLTRLSNGLSLSLCKLATTCAKPIQEKKRIRSSKSYVKGCKAHLKENGHENSLYSESRNLLKSVNIPDAITTLKKVSETIHQIKKANEDFSAYGTYSGQHKQLQSRKSLNSTIQRGIRKAAQSMKGKRSHNSGTDSSMKIKSGIIKDTSKCFEIKKELIASLKTGLKNVDKENYETNKALSEKFDVINETFNEVINLDNGYKNVLKYIQTKFVELFDEYNKSYKTTKDNLEKTQTKLSKLNEEFDTSKSENEKLKSDIAKLKEEIDQKSGLLEGQKAALKTKNSEIQNIKNNANKKIKELSKNLAALYNENKELAEIVESLYSELQHNKSKGKIVKKIVKGGIDNGDYKNKKKSLNKTVVEIGKNKVKVPVLDLSRLTNRKPAKLKVVQYCDNEGSEDNSEAINPDDSNIGINTYNIIEYVIENSESQAEEEGGDYIEYTEDDPVEMSDGLKTN